MMRPAAARRSIWTKSRQRVRDAYGRNLFGQGCLLARRLVERGVPFVEVSLSARRQRRSAGTRTSTISKPSKSLSEVLDPAGRR